MRKKIEISNNYALSLDLWKSSNENIMAVIIKLTTEKNSEENYILEVNEISNEKIDRICNCLQNIIKKSNLNLLKLTSFCTDNCNSTLKALYLFENSFNLEIENEELFESDH